VYIFEAAGDSLTVDAATTPADSDTPSWISITLHGTTDPARDV
jgi:hypothetical protein